MEKEKFKAKRIDTKEWVYGSLITKEIFSHEENRIIGEKTYIITYLADDLHSVDIFEVDPNTACQYIRLKDKNEIDIYEGDLVKEMDEIYTVMFSTENIESCGCCFEKFSGVGFIMQNNNSGARGFLVSDDEIPSSIEVVGSIHD